MRFPKPQIQQVVYIPLPEVPKSHLSLAGYFNSSSKNGAYFFVF